MVKKIVRVKAHVRKVDGKKVKVKAHVRSVNDRKRIRSDNTKKKIDELFKWIGHQEILDVAFEHPDLIDEIRKKYPYLTFSKKEWEETSKKALSYIYDEYFTEFKPEDGESVLIFDQEFENILTRNYGKKMFSWEIFKKDFMNWDKACEMASVLDKTEMEYLGMMDINGFVDSHDGSGFDSILETNYYTDVIKLDKIRGNEKKILEIEEFVDTY